MAKKKRKPLFGKFLGIVFLCGAIYFLFNIGMQALETIELQKQKELVEQQLSELKNENDELNSTKTKLENEDYVQTYARGEYMFSLQDEKVFYLPSSDSED